MNISKYISFDEATRSNTAKSLGMSNTPTDSELEAMKIIGKEFDSIREHFNEPILVTSFFRTAVVNAKIKGAKHSQHTKGEAIDMQFAPTSKHSNKELYEYVLNNIKFDQLIWEFGNDSNPRWVHFSVKKDGNRGQVLRVK